MGTPVDPEMKKKVENDLEVLERILQGRLWVAGNNITIADYALVVSATLPEVSQNFSIRLASSSRLISFRCSSLLITTST